ncbi:Ger(x)C family spore germination protein [Niallia sp. 01092]|uniref:Ger(x)C family spore germination protein n=1 Tax=unclassified Niallia TaxID=2837522 RepID=UPI003FD2D5FC
MKHNVIFMWLLCLTTTILSGCWDSRELPKLNIVSAIAIDKDDEDENRYRTTVQVINPPQVAGGQQGGKVQAAPVITLTNSGSTLSESLRKISPMLPGQLFFPHIQVMVISEDVAKDGIQHLFDVIERDSKFRLLFPVVIARNTSAKDILQITTQVYPIPSDEIDENLLSSEDEWGEFIRTQVDQVIEGLKEGSLVVSGIQITGNKEQGNKTENLQQISPGAKTEVGGLGLFTNGKLNTWLDGKTARGTTWIMNEMKKTVLNLDCKDMKEAISIELSRSKTKINVTIKNNQPVIQIHVNAEGTISETLCSIDLSQQKEIKKLEKEMEKEIKEEIKNTINMAQKEKSDFLGFGEHINMKDKKTWKKIEKKWDAEVFPKTEVNINVNAFIRRTGMLSNPSSK